MGLNDESFGNVRRQILAREPLPPLDEIFNIIQQEENHKRLMMERDHRTERQVAFAVKEKTTSERPVCAHCGKLGHDEAHWYELVGYPPNWGTQGCNRKARGGRTGHGEHSAGSRGRGSGHQAAHAALAHTEAVSGSVETDQAPMTIPGLSSEQVQRLLRLLEVPK